MLTKEKSLYQVKLILDYLPQEEYALIPKETIDYIEDNFEYDETVVIDPSTPLEKQKISEEAYKMLERIIKETDKAKKNKNANEKEEYLKKAKQENEEFDIKLENIKLKNIIETLKDQNAKMPQAKKLIENYQCLIKQKDDQIEKLKKSNEQLNSQIQSLPKFIRKVFIKDDTKLLNE